MPRIIGPMILFQSSREGMSLPIMPMGLRREPRGKTTEATRPRSIREKYSGAPKLKATLARGGARVAMTIVDTVPAKNDPMAAMARAGTALPFRASDSRRGW